MLGAVLLGAFLKTIAIGAWFFGMMLNLNGAVFFNKSHHTLQLAAFIVFLVSLSLGFMVETPFQVR